MAGKRNFKAEDARFSSFENTQVFLWQTQYDISDFAYCMNRLYGLQLSREQDYPFVTLDGRAVDCPNYLYYDEGRQLFYILVDNGMSGTTLVPELDIYDKVMFLYGRDSQEQCMMMHEEFNGEVKTEGEWDLLGNEHKDLMQKVIDGGVVNVDFFCFRTEHDYDTSVSYFENINANAKVGRRFNVFVKELQCFLDGLERKISMEEVAAKNEENGTTISDDTWVIG